ncbi:hypothetical protein [Polyangium aurulentum]|uniref:hypothetical protein n=1 Tax=Polyangium aurulentum TaxID=2567896 RepID=UPI0010AE29DF|nr:hypothetical protein [Polyangium aurulentum]UQA60571.1 hypothetical protein E8A73_008895 [Polyangium aurulentum]
MKTQFVLVSLLCAVAPLASACVAAEPTDIDPASAMVAGELVTLDEIEATGPEIQATPSVPAQTFLFPRQATPFGASYEDWAATWWQWALAIPKAENPILGGPCELHQTGDVFFLAGTTGGASTRSCTIPAGKGIFFPIANHIYKNCPEYVGQMANYTCTDSMDVDLLHDRTLLWATYDKDLLLEIDGVPVDGLDEYNAHSEAFTETSSTNVADRVFPACAGPIEANSCGVPVGTARAVVSDGYWAMLHPLPVGQHQIHFAATIYRPGNPFSLDVTYNIVVTP